MCPSCHWSWGAEGRGKMGSGGGFLSTEDEEEEEDSENERKSKRGNFEMEFAELWIFFFFMRLRVWWTGKNNKIDRREKQSQEWGLKCLHHFSSEAKEATSFLGPPIFLVGVLMYL